MFARNLPVPGSPGSPLSPNSIGQNTSILFVWVGGFWKKMRTKLKDYLELAAEVDLPFTPGSPCAPCVRGEKKSFSKNKNTKQKQKGIILLRFSKLLTDSRIFVCHWVSIKTEIYLWNSHVYTRTHIRNMNFTTRIAGTRVHSTFHCKTLECSQSTAGGWVFKVYANSGY